MQISFDLTQEDLNKIIVDSLAAKHSIFGKAYEIEIAYTLDEELTAKITVHEKSVKAESKFQQFGFGD